MPFAIQVMVSVANFRPNIHILLAKRDAIIFLETRYPFNVCPITLCVTSYLYPRQHSAWDSLCVDATYLPLSVVIVSHFVWQYLVNDKMSKGKKHSNLHFFIYIIIWDFLAGIDLLFENAWKPFLNTENRLRGQPVHWFCFNLESKWILKQETTI